MDIRSERDKAYLEYVKNNSMDNTWETCFEAGAKWMGERCAENCEDPNAENGTHFRCGDIFAKEIRSLIKELDNQRGE